MADNAELNSGSGGVIIAGASLSFSGDTSMFQIVGQTILAGSEGSWTQTLVVGGAGAVTGGVQRMTLASDDPAVALLGTIDTDTSALAGTVNGSELQVDIVGALPAGTNAIGKLAANSGVDIGDVDVLSVVPGSGATNLGKAEDAAHTTGHVGVMGLAVRTDTPANRSGTDGDYEPLQVSAGRLWASTLVTGSALTALELIDDAVHTDDAAFTLGTSKGIMMMGFAGTQSVNANDAAALACDTDGALHVSDGGNSLTVDSSDLSTLAGAVNGSEMQVDIVSSATITVDLGANNDVTIDGSSVVRAEDAAHNSGDTGIMGLAVRNDTLAALAGTDGDYAPFQVDANGALYVTIDGALINSPTATGTPTGESIKTLGLMYGYNGSSWDGLQVDTNDFLKVTQEPKTAGGLGQPFRSIDLDESEEEVKGSAGQVYKIYASNTSSSVRWVKVYNATAASVTVGTTTPVATLMVPPNSSGFILDMGELGWEFGTAITVAATTGVADSDTGAPGANEVVIHVWYE